MSEARGRSAQDSKEKQGSVSASEEQAMRTSNATLKAATATALAGTGFAAMGMAKLSESGADGKSTARTTRGSGGGGGLYVTPGTATKRDITKRFKNI
jgi:hypothetical protein